MPHINVIQSLDLSRTGSLTLSDAGFRDFDSVKILDVSQTGLTGLKSSWFSKKSIEELNVSENYIKALKKEETKFFARLRVFNASFNEIQTIEPNTFLESKKIEVISLSYNQIKNVAFENLQSLKHLYMKGNSIVTVRRDNYRRFSLINIRYLTGICSILSQATTSRNIEPCRESNHRSRWSKLFNSRKFEIFELE